ncbi:MAG: hypothetical protein AB1451_05785 [Nitrospirota bacterium]
MTRRQLHGAIARLRRDVRQWNTPDETEQALRRTLPAQYWIELNDLLVAYGQHRCTPQSPYCSRCELSRWCRRVGVTRTR